MAKPNWRKWLHIPEVRVWQACLLSLDIAPDSPDAFEAAGIGELDRPDISDTSLLIQEARCEYTLRLVVLCANLSEREHFSPATVSLNGNVHCGVRLAEFAAWAANVQGWELPQELTQLAAKPQAAVAPEQGSEPDKVSAAALPVVTTHKLKSRARELDAEIEQAKAQVTNPSDHNSVFAALAAIAKTGVAPFTGNVDSRGIEYRSNSTGKTTHLSKAALKERMRRDAERTQK